MNWFLYMVWDEGIVPFYCMWISSFSRTMCYRDILPPLCSLGTLTESQLTAHMWIYFWALYSIPFSYSSVFNSIPFSFEYWSFVIYFEIRKCDASNCSSCSKWFLLFKILCDFIWIWGFLKIFLWKRSVFFFYGRLY